MKYATLFFFFVAVAVGLWGCAEPIDEAELVADGGGEGVSVTFRFGSVDGALNPAKMKTFRIRVYAGPPADKDSPTLFDSAESGEGCHAVTSTDVKIKDLKAGLDRFVYYEAFSDSECKELSAIGVRGGVPIGQPSPLAKEAASVECTADDSCKVFHPDTRCDCQHEKAPNGKDLPNCVVGTSGFCKLDLPVFIPLYEVGKFNKLPLPSKELVGKARQVSCEDDAVCQEKVHKAAVCNTAKGVCTVEGLFPFAPSRPRAFHTATTLPNGRVVFSGGFNRDELGTFRASSPFFEEYDPQRCLFVKSKLEENFVGPGTALHRTTFYGGENLFISGGVSEMQLKYELADVKLLSWIIPHSYECESESCQTISGDLITANYRTGEVRKNPLRDEGTGIMGLFAHRSQVVDRSGVTQLFLSGGLTFRTDSSVEPWPNAFVCNLEDVLKGNSSCAPTTTDDFPPRFGAADVCLLAAQGEACVEYLIFGGVSEEDSELCAQVISSDASGDGQTDTLLGFTEMAGNLGMAHFAEIVKRKAPGGTPDWIYLFGGVSNVVRMNLPAEGGQGKLILNFRPPDIQPVELTVNLKSGITPDPLNISDLDPATEVYRIFHTVTTLSDPDEPSNPHETIVVIGGLGSDNLPAKNALFFTDPNALKLTYKRKVPLKEPRFGHTATEIRTGLLKGAVLVVGGFTVTDTKSGTIGFAESAEIYIPEMK